MLPYCAPEHGAFREALILHAIQTCQALLSGQNLEPSAGGLHGAYDVDGRTAPVATRLEGLLAALEFLPIENERLRSQIEHAVTSGVGFLLRVQIESGRCAGGIPGAYIAGSPGSSEIRIDYVQHAMCAWLQYRKLLGASAGAAAAPRKATIRASKPS